MADEYWQAKVDCDGGEDGYEGGTDEEYKSNVVQRHGHSCCLLVVLVK